MIVNLSKTVNHAKWQSDLEIGMSLIGSYKMQLLQNELMKSINTLVDILNHFQGVSAFRLDKAQCPADYVLGIKVSHWQVGFPFQAFVKFELDQSNVLFGVLHYSSFEAIGEKPSELQRTWQTAEFRINPAEISGVIATQIKNEMIQFLVTQVHGDKVEYTILD
jgi:hypothetical protein